MAAIIVFTAVGISNMTLKLSFDYAYKMDALYCLFPASKLFEKRLWLNSLKFSSSYINHLL
jgi:hypothetical protein